MERCVALPYSSLKSSETHAVNPELCAPPRAVKIMTFFFSQFCLKGSSVRAPEPT